MTVSSPLLPQVYLNGEILPIENAQVPVLDRGFLFGDAIYEVVPVYQGQLFRADDHIQRLINGLQAIGIETSISEPQWHDILQQTVSANLAAAENSDMMIYVQVTRGAGRWRDHAMPGDATPLVFAMAQRLTPRNPAIAQHGTKVITREDNRWGRCDIKATSLLANVLLRQEAIDAQCSETILHRDGQVTEGAASTIMLVLDGTLICRPDSRAILPGTTRRYAAELAQRCGITVEVRTFTLEELYQADEVLLSAATKEVIAVCQVDDKKIGQGIPGEVWQKLDNAYQQDKLALVQSAT